MPGAKTRASDDAAGATPPPGEALRRAVLAALGRPPGLLRVAVSPLWGDYFRVNVVTGDDATSARVAHSYFVEASPDGAVRAATPALRRAYP